MFISLVSFILSVIYPLSDWCTQLNHLSGAEIPFLNFFWSENPPKCTASTASCSKVSVMFHTLEFFSSNLFSYILCCTSNFSESGSRLEVCPQDDYQSSDIFFNSSDAALFDLSFFNICCWKGLHYSHHPLESGHQFQTCCWPVCHPVPWRKDLISKSSRSLIIITPNHVHSNHNSQPDSNLSDYLNFHICLHKYLMV